MSFNSSLYEVLKANSSGVFLNIINNSSTNCYSFFVDTTNKIL